MCSKHHEQEHTHTHTHTHTTVQERDDKGSIVEHRETYSGFHINLYGEIRLEVCIADSLCCLLKLIQRCKSTICQLKKKKKDLPFVHTALPAEGLAGF